MPGDASLTPVLNLDCSKRAVYLNRMRLNVAQEQNLEDRARLRERFFGAARTVLARLPVA